jgi:hypothetical protein
MAGRPQGSHNTPIPISYRQVQLAFFIHDGTIYSVISAPASLFREVIRDAMDTTRLTVLSGAIEEANGLLNGDLGTLERWWLLAYVALRHTGRPLKLYFSKQEAVQALKYEALGGGITECESLR